MEKFDINSQNEFQKKSSGEMILDGKFSDAEKRELIEALKGEKSDIFDTTNEELAKLLYNDVIPNLETSGLSDTLKKQLKDLGDKHVIEETDTIAEDTELLQYFGISEDTATAVTESLAPFNMQIADKLQSYKTYIESELQLPPNSSLSSDNHSKILSSVIQNITSNISNIPELVSSEREKYNSLNNKEIVGIINDSIEEGFQITKETILPNTKLYLTSTTPGFFENSKDIFYSRGLENNADYTKLDRMTQGAQRKFMSEVRRLGEVLISGDLSDIPDVFHGWGEIGTLFEESFGLQDGLQQISNSSFLSQQDAERYKSAKIRAAIFMILQILPTGVTDIASIGIDASDTFSKTDQSFAALKKLGMIDGDIHVGKVWWERGLSAVGALGGAVSLDVATKGSRAIRILQSAGITTGDMLQEVKRFSGDLGLSEDMGNTLRRSISIFSKNRGNQKFMETARHNGRLSDTPETDTFEIGGEVLKVSAREKAFLNRLENAYQNKEVPFSLEDLKTTQLQHLLNTLNQMHNMHGNVPIGKHRLSQIADKLKIAKENGIPNYIAKLAIKEGFAGVSEVKNIFGFNAHTFKIMNEKDPEIAILFENISSSGGDIGAALSKVNFDSGYLDSYINGLGGGWIEGADIKKLQNFLEDKGIEVPKEFLQEAKDNDGVGTFEKEMGMIFDLLKQAKGGEKVEGNSSLGNINTVESVTDVSKTTKADDAFEEIRKDQPEVVVFFEALLDEGTHIGESLSAIKFDSDSVHDAIDFMIENGNGLISSSKLEEVAIALQRKPSVIISDLDFIDGEAGITEDFLRGVFNIQEEIITGVKVSNNPLDMPIKKLARIIKSNFSEKGEEISGFIQDTPDFQTAVKILEHVDYHDVDFLENDLWKIVEFYERFGEDATKKLITDVFQKPNTDFSKLFANIKRYDESIQLAQRNNTNRLTSILQSVGISTPSTTMIERLKKLELYRKSEWVNSDIDSIAHSVGKDPSLAGLYIDLGKNNFIQLLKESGIDIPVEKQNDFLATIEQGSDFKTVKLVSESQVSHIHNARNALTTKIQSFGGKSVNKANFLEGFDSSSKKAYDYISNLDFGVISNEKDILIINGDNISKIPKSKVTDALKSELARAEIYEIQGHELSTNDIMLATIHFLNLTQ